MKTIIIVSVVLALVLIIVLLLASKKNKKVESVIEETEEEKQALNQADVNMMQGLNAGGFAAKKVEQSNIPIPDFKKDKPIGYKDLSHISNTYGEKVVNTNNNVK